MDLKSFTNKKEKKTLSDSKVIEDNNDIKITKSGDFISYKIKTKKGLKEYQDKIFFSVTKSLISKDKEELEDFFRDSINDGVEGLMVKSLDFPYKPGIRTGAMAKLKEVKEDVDLVILGAEHGKGKRAGYFSSFLIAARNDESENNDEDYLIVGKVSSGIKELGTDGATLEKLTELLMPLKTHEDKNIVYFEPKIVIEVRYQEIQKSSSYNSKIALRFPRIMNLREDKNLEEINSVSELEKFAQI